MATAVRVNGVTTQVTASAVESHEAAKKLNAQAGTLGDTVAMVRLEDPGVGRRRPVRCAYGNTFLVTRPPTSVSRLVVPGSAGGGTVKMSCDSTARSASMPGASVPLSFSACCA